jgi:hypothetical protein
MPTDIVIQVGDEEFAARLSEERSPETVRRILEALPIQATASTWGDEVYFAIPVDMAEENAVAQVRVGDLGYWPAGSCFCIFYGRTPMSRSDEAIVPASPVNLIGTVEAAERLKAHRAGEEVAIRLAN